MAKTKLYTFYMGLYGPPTRHVFKMASPAVTWMPFSNLWRTKCQRSGQVYHTHSFTKGGLLATAFRLVVSMASEACRGLWSVYGNFKMQGWQSVKAL